MSKTKHKAINFNLVKTKIEDTVVKFKRKDGTVLEVPAKRAVIIKEDA